MMAATAGQGGNIGTLFRPDRENGWCILRTNGRRTLRLARSLANAGIESWTPRIMQKRKLSRTHLGFREVEEPMMPSFVFARSRHLGDLLRILALPNSPHPAFSIFQHAGRAPVIGDRDIVNLQAAEEKGRRARRKTQRHVVAVGTRISPDEGAFAGLEGVVVGMLGKQAVVDFGGKILFSVASWLLVEDAVEAA